MELGLNDLSVGESCKGHEELLKDFRLLSEGSATDLTLYSFPSPGNENDIDAYYDPRSGKIVKIPDDVDVEVNCVCENGKWVVKIDTDTPSISNGPRIGFKPDGYNPDEYDP